MRLLNLAVHLPKEAVDIVEFVDGLEEGIDVLEFCLTWNIAAGADPEVLVLATFFH